MLERSGSTVSLLKSIPDNAAFCKDVVAELESATNLPPPPPPPLHFRVSGLFRVHLDELAGDGAGLDALFPTSDACAFWIRFQVSPPPPNQGATPSNTEDCAAGAPNEDMEDVSGSDTAGRWIGVASASPSWVRATCPRTSSAPFVFGCLLECDDAHIRTAAELLVRVVHGRNRAFERTDWARGQAKKTGAFRIGLCVSPTNLLRLS